MSNIISPINRDNLSTSKIHISYKDILLVPFNEGFCEIKSRNDPDIYTYITKGRSINGIHDGDRIIDIPIISSPMDTITSVEMAIALNNAGAMGVYTRHINDPDENQKQQHAVKQIHQNSTDGFIACATGVKDKSKQSLYDHIMSLCDIGLDIIFLDIANGNHIFMRDVIKKIQPLVNRYDLGIVAGNVATGESATRLADCGADGIRIGIGPGAICSTRRITGFGVPQFTAILDCAEKIYKSGHRTTLIADGGCRSSGDIVKSLWAGADAVMLGYMLSGHDECPKINGERQYRGMSSRNVSQRDDIAAEGVCINVQPKGPVQKTINEYAAAIRAGCSMANANNLKELRKNVQAIRVSTMTQAESDTLAD